MLATEKSRYHPKTTNGMTTISCRLTGEFEERSVVPTGLGVPVKAAEHVFHAGARGIGGDHVLARFGPVVDRWHHHAGQAVDVLSAGCDFVRAGSDHFLWGMVAARTRCV